MAAIDKFLRKIYYDPASPASYSGVQKLWSVVKKHPDKPLGLNLPKLVSWLNSQNVHTIHKKPVSVFRHERLIFDQIDQQWFADLVYIGYPSENNNFRNILTVIDGFSRFLWTRPLKSKTSMEVAQAFSDILAEGRHCTVLQTDQGAEFLGRPFKTELSQNKIQHLLAYGEFKCAIVERVNRTIEDKLFKYFYEQQTHKFVDVLDKITHSYNLTQHRFLKMAPAEINNKNSFKVYEQIYMPIVVHRGKNPINYAFEIGTLVRLARGKEPFLRGYDIQWSEELFKIIRLIPSHPPRYRVSSLNDKEIIRGTFYKEELLPVGHEHTLGDIQFKIEKIIKTKKVKGKKFGLIKWMNYSSDHNTWVPFNQIKTYQGKK